MTTMVALTLFATMGYLFLVVSTTINVADRKHFESEIRNIQANMAEMELDYFEKTNAIDIELAGAYNLVESEQSYFAYSTSAVQSDVALAPTE